MKIFVAVVLCLAHFQEPVSPPQSDRAHNGFVGPVKKVSVVWTPVSGSNYPEGSKCRQLTDEYDETGRITRHSVYPGACGSDEIREDYTYAQDGSQIVKRQEIRAPNSPPPPPPAARPNTEKQSGRPTQTLKYDSTGRLIEKASLGPDGTLLHRNTYSYDENGRLIETTGYDNDGRPSDRRMYGYSADQRVPSRFVYYGRDGKVYEQTSYTDYEFNSTGDWIKRKQTKEETFNRRSISLTFREIEYYSPKRL